VEGRRVLRRGLTHFRCKLGEFRPEPLRGLHIAQPAKLPPYGQVVSPRGALDRMYQFVEGLICSVCGL
jgi:hypothetical protein